MKLNADLTASTHRICEWCQSPMPARPGRGGDKERFTCSTPCRLARVRSKTIRRAEEDKKNCETCGREFQRKILYGQIRKHQSPKAFAATRFCSRVCARSIPRKDGSVLSRNGIAWRAMNQVKKHNIKQICARCHKSNTKNVSFDIHHKDHDITNNDIGNLEVLCKKCHMAHHWQELSPRQNFNKRCIIDKCERNRSNLCIFCAIHRRRWMSYGDPLALFQHGENPIGGRKQLAGCPVAPRYMPGPKKVWFYDDHKVRRDSLTWQGNKIFVPRPVFFRKKSQAIDEKPKSR